MVLTIGTWCPRHHTVAIAATSFDVGKVPVEVWRIDSEVGKLEMDEPFQLVAPRTGFAYLDATSCKVPVVGILGAWPKSAQVSLLGLALLVPFRQPFRQLDCTADFDVNESRVSVVCTSVQISKPVGECDPRGAPSISKA